MRNLFLFLVAAFLVSCTGQPAKEKEKADQDHLVMSVLWYQRAAEMRALYHQGFNLAKLRLEGHLKSYKGGKKPAVVVDIDETMLDNSPFEGKVIETGKPYGPETWKEWTSKASAKALPGAVEFANFALSKGVDIIYVSNRRVDKLEETRKNLEKEGFPNAKEEFILLRKDTGSKEERRKHISESFEILLLIGDNLGDFSQVFEDRGSDFGFSQVEKFKNTFGDRFIVLPNPMYGEWEKMVYGGSYKLREQEKCSKRKEKVISY